MQKILFIPLTCTWGKCHCYVFEERENGEEDTVAPLSYCGKRRTAVAVDLTEATPMSPPGRGGLRRVREPVINCPWPQLCL